MNRERQPQSNVILWNIDNLKIKFVKTGVLNPNLLLTENRQDVNLRIKFLKDIFENKIDLEKTQYFKFISDNDKGVRRNSKESVEDFKKLFFSIEKYGILEPVLVGKFEQKKIQTRYIETQPEFYLLPSSIRTVQKLSFRKFKWRCTTSQHQQ